MAPAIGPPDAQASFERQLLTRSVASASRADKGRTIPRNAPQDPRKVRSAGLEAGVRDGIGTRDIPDLFGQALRSGTKTYQTRARQGFLLRALTSHLKGRFLQRALSGAGRCRSG